MGIGREVWGVEGEVWGVADTMFSCYKCIHITNH